MACSSAVERLTVNQVVAGSIPAMPAIVNKRDSALISQLPEEGFATPLVKTWGQNKGYIRDKNKC